MPTNQVPQDSLDEVPKRELLERDAQAEILETHSEAPLRPALASLPYELGIQGLRPPLPVSLGTHLCYPPGVKFGHKLRNLRVVRGLRQKDLAEACGITEGAISRLESEGGRGPRGGHILGLATVLHVPANYLLDESQPYPYEPVKRRKQLKKEDDSTLTSMRVTRDEQALLEALRGMKTAERDLAYGVPELPLEALWIVWQVMGREALQTEGRSTSSGRRRRGSRVRVDEAVPEPAE